MSWPARERQRDKKIGRVRRGLVSWPTLVLVAGIVLSLAANLHQAQPSVWGWLTAATPAGAFLIAVSMIERRSSGPRIDPSAALPSAPVTDPVSPALNAPSSTVPASSSASVIPSPADGGSSSAPAAVPIDQDGGKDDTHGPSSALIDYARRIADEHHAKHGKPITRDLLRARLGVSNQLASDLLRTLRTTPNTVKESRPCVSASKAPTPKSPT